MLQNLITVRVGGVPEHFNSPWHIARDQGWFAEAGLDLQFTEYPTGTGALCQDLRQGVLDLAIVLTEGIVADIARTGQSRILAPYIETPLVWGIHTGRASELQAPTELRGKTFAISRFGSGSHLMSLLFARDQGWQPSELQFAEAGGIEALQDAVNSGGADSFLWEKFTTKPRVDAGKLERIGEYPTPWPCFVLAVSDQAWADKAEALNQLLEVLYRSTQAFMDSPEASVNYAAQRYGLQPEDTHEWFHSVRWATEQTLRPEMLEQVMQHLQQVGVIEPAQTRPAKALLAV